MCPSLIQIGSKTAEKNSAQTNRQTDRHYENNGHLAVNQYLDVELGGPITFVAREQYLAAPPQLLLNSNTCTVLRCYNRRP